MPEDAKLDFEGIAPAPPVRRALFLDRDGVINEEIGYLHRAEDCVLVPGIGALLRTARKLEYVCCVVTNQAGIGRGMYSEAAFHRLMDHIARELDREGAALDAVYFSPYHPVHGIGPFQRDSPCRKPAPGMLLQAAADHNLDLPNSVMVGDRCSDLRAGHAAGLQELFLFGTAEAEPCTVDFRYTRVYALSSIEQALTASFRPNQGLQR